MTEMARGIEARFQQMQDRLDMLHLFNELRGLLLVAPDFRADLTVKAD
ncbi:hypothetical protein NKI41_32150 [Mesorhizobium sp. M0601]